VQAERRDNPQPIMVDVFMVNPVRIAHCLNSGRSMMSQTLVKIYVHLVFSTKHRAPMISAGIESRLHGYMTGIIKKRESLLVRIGGIEDHVHALVLLSKNDTVADLLQVTKKESSRWIKKQGAEFGEFYWQDGYAGFSVSESAVERCVAYINNQKTHHARMGFQPELRMLLKKHKVAFDERYLWE
jgi:REP element-mobilizing transposase RayT